MKRVIIVVCLLLLAIAGFWLRRSGKTTYQSPVDEKGYEAHWRTYKPTNVPEETDAATNRVQKQEVRLLSTQEEFSRSIDASELADFIRKTESEIESSLGGTNEAFELVIQTQLTKDKKPSFEMASKGNVSEDLLQRISDSFQKLPDYRSQKDDLKYEIRFTIRTPENRRESTAGVAPR
jgi:hypothetical protein